MKKKQNPDQLSLFAPFYTPALDSLPIEDRPDWQVIDVENGGKTLNQGLGQTLFWDFIRELAMRQVVDLLDKEQYQGQFDSRVAEIRKIRSLTGLC